jgi:hypothetical protein
MQIHRVILTFVLLALAALGASPARAQSGGTDPWAQQLEKAGQSLQVFVRTRAPATLEHALTSLELVETPPTRGPRRDRVTDAWFALLRALDMAKDPAFDPDDLPKLHLIPPPDHGVVYPAGVDPRAISDPAARAAYEAALRDNARKSARFVAQYPLHELDARATSAFARYRERSYAATPVDAADFARLLGKSGLSTARRSSIRP